MVPVDFSWKRICVQILVWSGLLFKSRCDDAWTEEGGASELGVLGSPVQMVTTVTVTTTIASNPTLAPGDSTYSLVGCYSQNNSDSGGGHPFGEGQGWGYDTPPTVPLDKLTTAACVKGCMALRPVEEILDNFKYMGLWDGWQCVCGLQLVPEARKLSPEECNTPCSGDPMHLCGGKDSIAVYSLLAAGGPGPSPNSTASDVASSTGGDQDNDSLGGTKREDGSISLSLSSSATSASAQLRTTSVSQSIRTNPKSSSKRTSTPSSSSTTSFATSSPSDSPNTSISSSAIGAITGSVSGAIILVAALFLCFKAYKRKKQRQETHVTVALNDEKEVRHSRRLIPRAIDTTKIRSFGKYIKLRGRREQGGDDAGIGIATESRDFVPTTPALESGGRLHPSGLHPRRKSATSSSDRDSLYGTLMEEVRAGPAIHFVTPPPYAPQQSGASSAVDWRSPVSPVTPVTPKTAPAVSFEFGFTARNRSSSSIVANPSPAARPNATLGDRAWHRRRLSTPFQPPPSGPPSVPLPPTPPKRSQRSIDAVLLSTTPASKSKLKSSRYKRVEKGESSRSSGPSPTSLKPDDLYILGAPANNSSPAIGTPVPTPPPRDPARLSRTQNDSRSPGLEEGSQTGAEGVTEEAVSPTLPLIIQGEPSDPPLRRNTLPIEEREGDRGGSEDINTKEVGNEQEQEKRQEEEKGKGKEDLRSSSTTVGTSILFPSEGEHTA
ncbi:hypothetical protein F5Y13DRAFT_84487 [Hypoxylon sp. FL1857]|nr:hypothetical protein F5Y13DRAFT_84487 [Hypoxylon sp. FL1857]